MIVGPRLLISKKTIKNAEYQLLEDFVYCKSSRYHLWLAYEFQDSERSLIFFHFLFYTETQSEVSTQWFRQCRLGIIVRLL